MDAPPSDAISAYTAFIHQLNDLKLSVFIGLGTGLMVLVVCWVFLKWLDWRTTRTTEAAKTKRAEAYAKAMEALASAVSNQTASGAIMHASMTDTLTGLTAATDRVDKSMAVVLQRTSGQISRSASMKFVEQALAGVVTREVSMNVERSLRENHWDENGGYIANRVRTEISNTLSRCRGELQALPLAFNPNVFFPTYVGEGGGERFGLVDTVWDAILPIHAHSDGDVKARIDEANLAISNIIRDHYSRIQAQLSAAKPDTEAQRDVSAVHPAMARSAIERPKCYKSFRGYADTQCQVCPFSIECRRTSPTAINMTEPAH